jgi:hypothetical protein
MTAPETPQDRTSQFAWCIQLFGGVTAASRRLGIDERALRRFTTGERPVSDGLLADTAKVLNQLSAETAEAAAAIAALLAAGEPG